MKLRILFVDDEADLLRGLRLRLRAQRQRWEMRFAHGPSAALALLEDSPVDVVVTDMRMPQMDGIAVLEAVRERYPDAMRIILSGQTAREDVARAMTVTHHFLAKPCEAEVLINCIERCTQLRALLDDVGGRAIAGTVAHIPALPEHFLRLSRHLDGEQASADSVARIVEEDPGLSAGLLRLANSAYYDAKVPVTAVRDAVVFLGFETVRSLLLSLELFAALDGPRAAATLDYPALQWHSLQVARLAAKIVTDPQDARAAFSAAMLHDVGKLVLAVEAPESYDAAAAMSAERNCPVHQCERELLGYDHALLGAYLLGLWGLPYAVVEAVAFHHQPAALAPVRFDATCGVYVANELLHCRDTELSRPRPDPAVLERWGVHHQLPGWLELSAAAAK